MKYISSVNLWNKDQWVYFWKPFNLLSLKFEPMPDRTHVIFTILGFVFFFESGYIQKG